MKLSAEQIQKNWENHLKYVEHFISEPRRSKVLEMLKGLEERIILAPASSKEHFHNAFPGGYVEHTNRVLQCSLKVLELWESMGATIDFTVEELAFSALMHDLGKIGDGEHDTYIPQTSNWRRENMGEMYEIGESVSFMLPQDRSLYLLQKYGITGLSEKEYLAIRLHDGVYDDANKAYFFSRSPSANFRTNIVYVLHQADFMASKVEYDRWRITK